MADTSLSQRPSSHRSSSALAASRSSDSNSVRPRNRRLISTLNDEDDNTSISRKPSQPSNRSSGLFSSFSASTSRTASPYRLSQPDVGPNRGGPAASDIGSFLSDSWTQSWASVQGLASSLISGKDAQPKTIRSQPTSRAGSRPATWGRGGSSSRPGLGAWGPAPPSKNPGLSDVAAGSLAEREAALKAAKKASVLESHDGVNGGLDIAGKHKRRNSDEVVIEQPEIQEYLVYIHKVQPNDTYAGLILRYQCREDAFRKANGLWSRDSVQMRKWLTIPVDACEIRGRPCDPPSWHNSHGVDLLAPTPTADDGNPVSQAPHDDFFSRPANGTSVGSRLTEEEENPWTHVRWVKIDSFQDPVEIARVARKAMGYFPPRRKKSIRTISTFSTPRQSLDLASNPPGSIDGLSSRRQSALGPRPQLSATAMSSPSRGRSDSTDRLPAWMLRPGGVGSMGRNVRAPGPDKDVLTSWTKKHFPGLNNDNMPSMSIMGSETAHFGFKPEAPGLVESHIGEGQDISSTTQQGNGLDKAAAAVETWLRGALARTPSAQIMGKRGKPGGEGDLIELTDTGSDDGFPASGLLQSLSLGSSSRSDGDGFVRGRTMGPVSKGQKDD